MDRAGNAALGPAVARWAARIGVGVAKTLFAGFVVCLVVSALAWTAGYVLHPGPYVEKGITERDTLWVTLPVGTVATLGVWGLERLATRLRWTTPNLRRTVGYIVFAQALTWSLMVQQVAWADMQTTLDLGRALADDRPRRLLSGYLETYPFQIGLVAYFHALALVFGDWTVYAVKVLNAVYLALTVGLMSRLADGLWHSPRTTRTFLLLAPAFFPLAMHSVQVYGDAPARLLGTAAILATVLHLRGRSHWWMAAAWACLGVGCVLRTNLVIVAAGIAAVLLARALRRLEWRPVVAAVLMATVTVPAAGVRLGYESWYGVDLGPGLPRSAWVAIGLGEGNHDAGWYEPSIVYYYTFYSNDAPMTDAYSRAVIDGHLRTFAEDPLYAGDFFRRKFVSQWADPDFEATRLSTLQPAPFDSRSRLGDSMLYGTGRQVVWTYLDGLQSAIGFLVLAWCGMRLRRARLDELLPAVVVLGGAMFHMVWEAKARYAFEYYPYLLLYAAAGLTLLAREWTVRTRLDHQDKAELAARERADDEAGPTASGPATSGASPAPGP